MYLKRIYEPGSQPPKLSRIDVLHAGEKQHFSVRFLAGAIEAGWAAIRDGVIYLNTTPPLTYRVQRVPGAYCCHCTRGMASTDEARRHVAEEHPEMPSPDRSNPAGYEHIHYYDCIRIDQGG